MISRLARPLAAVLLLAGGLLHYNLWHGGYRHIPKIGPLFLANVVISVVLAVAVAASRRPVVAVAGILFAGGSLVALVLSRTVGVLGFMERIWTPTAVKALASEIGVMFALSVALTAQLRVTRRVVLLPTTPR